MKRAVIAAAAAGFFSVAAFAEPTETGAALGAAGLPDEAVTGFDAVFGGESPNPFGEGVLNNSIWSELEASPAGINPGSTVDTALAGVITTVASLDVPPEFPTDPTTIPDLVIETVSGLLVPGANPLDPVDPVDPAGPESAPLSIGGTIAAREDACTVDLPASVNFDFGTIAQADLGESETTFASDAVSVSVTCGADRTGNVALKLGTDAAATTDIITASFESSYEGPSAFAETEPTTIAVQLAFDDAGLQGTAVGKSIVASTAPAVTDIFATITPTADQRLGGSFDTADNADLTLFAVISY